VSRRLALALLLACPMALWPIAASAQDGRADPARNSDVANQEEILDRLEELVASITEAGIIAFDGISYPFIVLKGGDEPGMAVFESASELAPGGEPLLILSDAEIHLLGDVAVAEFVYGPADEPRIRAVAFAVLHRPGEVWMVKALGLAPATPLAAPSEAERGSDAPRPLSDRDVVSALLGSFVKMLTTTGPQEFSGLRAPFMYLDGSTAAFALYARSSDFPPPGDALDLDPRDIRASVLPGIAMARATVYGPEAYSDLHLLCVRAEWGWQVTLACAGPAVLIEELPEQAPDEDAQPEARPGRR